MKYKVLQKFLTKSAVYLPGDTYEHPCPGRFTKNLIKYGFIEKINEEDAYARWEKDGIRSKLANIIVAPENYIDGKTEHFSYDQAIAIEKQLQNGWRLPTRQEWVLLAEEFGCKNGELDVQTLKRNLKLEAAGLVNTSGLVYTGSYGRYWSSTAYNSSNAYYLDFYSSNIYAGTDYGLRYYGFSVRCVKDMEG